MEFLKQLSCPCGGALLEHVKQLLSSDTKPGDVLQKFTSQL